METNFKNVKNSKTVKEDSHRKMKNKDYSNLKS